MLFPENPDKRPELWQSLESQLLRDRMCFVVSGGSGNPATEAQAPVKALADAILFRLRSSQICRIGSSKGNAVSPHFAGRLEGTRAFLDELISYPSSGKSTVDIKQLRNDLETVAVDLFMTAGAKSVKVPLRLESWETGAALITSEGDGIVFTDTSVLSRHGSPRGGI